MPTWEVVSNITCGIVAIVFILRCAWNEKRINTLHEVSCKQAYVLSELLADHPELTAKIGMTDSIKEMEPMMLHWRKANAKGTWKI